MGGGKNRSTHMCIKFYVIRCNILGAVGGGAFCQFLIPGGGAFYQSPS